MCLQNYAECAYVYRTGMLLGACTYTFTGKKYALIREMHLIKSAFSMQVYWELQQNMRLTANMRLINAPVRYVQCVYKWAYYLQTLNMYQCLTEWISSVTCSLSNEHTTILTSSSQPFLDGNNSLILLYFFKSIHDGIPGIRQFFFLFPLIEHLTVESLLIFSLFLERIQCWYFDIQLNSHFVPLGWCLSSNMSHQIRQIRMIAYKICYNNVHYHTLKQWASYYVETWSNVATHHLPWDG